MTDGVRDLGVLFEEAQGLRGFDRVSFLAADKAVEIGMRHGLNAVEILCRFTAEWPSAPAAVSIGFLMVVEKRNRAIVEHQRRLVERLPPTPARGVGGTASTRSAHTKRKRKGGRR